MAVGETARLTRLLEDVELDGQVLKYLEEHSLMPGRDLTLVEVAPDETRTLEVNGERVALGHALADNLWVLPAN
jgi:Fe2+ transport system protein FeoA